MSDIETRVSGSRPKAKWTTPIVRHLKAGAAEVGTAKLTDDADGNSAKDNS